MQKFTPLQALAMAENIFVRRGIHGSPDHAQSEQETLKRLADWWNFVALPLVDPTYTPPAWAEDLIEALSVKPL